MSADAAPPPPFRIALRATAGSWVPAAVLVAAATWGAAGALGPLPFVHAAIWLLSGLLLIPLLFALMLGAATTLASLLLAALALPWWLCGRPTGLLAALTALWALPAAILPGYWSALRRVRRPLLWGAVLGFCVGIGGFVAMHGCRPIA